MKNIQFKKFRKAIPKLIKNNKISSARNWLNAAKAIMTTDTIPKMCKNSFFFKQKKNKYSWYRKRIWDDFPKYGHNVRIYFY